MENADLKNNHPRERIQSAERRWRNLLLISIGLTAGAAGQLQAQVSSPVSGFSTLQIRGHHNLTTTALSFVGLGLTRHPVYQGRIDSFGPGMISDSRVKWMDGAFNGSNGPHYLEITSGPYEGFTTAIASTRAATKSLLLDVDIASLLTGGESYKIRPEWTLAAIFGPADESGLGSGSLVTADEVLMLDPGTGMYRTYYYKTIGLGGIGWRSTSSPFADQSNTPLCLGQGLIICRKQASDISLKLFGAAKSDKTLLQISPGLNIQANVAPMAMTLASSGLYTGDQATGLAGGSISSADKILLFDGETYQSFYYQKIGLGGTGWRSAVAPFLDASATIIPAGSALVIQRMTSRAGFFWAVPAPF